MPHEQLKRALSEALIAEYEQSVPKTAPHEFSPEFEKKMNTLIRRRNKPYYRIINTAGKRIACIAGAVLIISTFSVLKADAIRSAFNDFTVRFRSVFSTVRPVDPHDAPKTIEEKYVVTYPFDEGFAVDFQYESDTLCQITYRKDDTTVFFDQYTKEMFDADVNTENAEMIPYSVNGKEAIFFLDNLGAYHLIWDDGDYILYLLANVDKNTFLEIAESIKKAE